MLNGQSYGVNISKITYSKIFNDALIEDFRYDNTILVEK